MFVRKICAYNVDKIDTWLVKLSHKISVTHFLLIETLPAVQNDQQSQTRMPLPRKLSCSIQLLLYTHFICLFFVDTGKPR